MPETVTTPFRIGRVISRSISIFSKNFIPFSALTFLIMSPGFIFNLVKTRNTLNAIGGTGTTASPAFQTGAGDLILMALNTFLLGILVAALVFGTIQELNGQRAGLKECVRNGFSRMFPVLGVVIVYYLALSFGMVLLIIPGIMVACIYIAAVPVAVVEKPGVFASLGRSGALTKDYRWRIFGLLLIWVVASSVISTVTMFSFGFDALTGIGSGGFDFTAFMIILTLNFVVSSFFGALLAIMTAVVYHDLRVAKEGIDTEQIAAVFD